MIYQIGETKRQKGGMTVQLNKALDLWVVLCNNFEGVRLPRFAGHSVKR